MTEKKTRNETKKKRIFFKQKQQQQNHTNCIRHFMNCTVLYDYSLLYRESDRQMSLCMAYYNFFSSFLFFFFLSNEFYSIPFLFSFIFNNQPELITISRFRKTTVLILCKNLKLPSNPHLFQVLFFQYSRSVSIVCVMHLKCVVFV